MPEASTTAAEGGASTVAPTPAILPAWTHTDPFWIVPWLAVITVAFLMTRSAGVEEAWGAAIEPARERIPTAARRRAARQPYGRGSKMCIKSPPEEDAKSADE
jgi:hypothetical protein